MARCGHVFGAGCAGDVCEFDPTPDPVEALTRCEATSSGRHKGCGCFDAFHDAQPEECDNPFICSKCKGTGVDPKRAEALRAHDAALEERVRREVAGDVNMWDAFHRARGEEKDR
jgi:hypothetical protein